MLLNPKFKDWRTIPRYIGTSTKVYSCFKLNKITIYSFAQHSISGSELFGVIKVGCEIVFQTGTIGNNHEICFYRQSWQNNCSCRGSCLKKNKWKILNFFKYLGSHGLKLGHKLQVQNCGPRIVKICMQCKETELKHTVCLVSLCWLFDANPDRVNNSQRTKLEVTY